MRRVQQSGTTSVELLLGFFIDIYFLSILGSLGKQPEKLEKSPGFTTRSMCEDELTAGLVYHNTLQLYIEASEDGYLNLLHPLSSTRGNTRHRGQNHHQTMNHVSTTMMSRQQPPSLYHNTTIHTIAYQNYSHTMKKLRTSPSLSFHTIEPSDYTLY